MDKLAIDIEVEDQVAEEDGAAFEVTAITAAGRGRLTFTLTNVHHYPSAPETLTTTVRVSALIRMAEKPTT